jgi:hypothetical protein
MMGREKLGRVVDCGLLDARQRHRAKIQRLDEPRFAAAFEIENSCF